MAGLYQDIGPRLRFLEKASNRVRVKVIGHLRIIADDIRFRVWVGIEIVQLAVAVQPDESHIHVEYAGLSTSLRAC